MKWIIGIDEAGRGPLAGPVTIGAFAAPMNARNKLIKILGGKIKDSKQLSPNERYTIYRKLYGLKKRGMLDFKITHISNKIIDRRGINEAVQRGIRKVLSDCQGRALTVRLDGLLKAPKHYKNQKTIIKGDEKDIFIACASIVAKVRRDRLMRCFAKKYPNYGFEIHKGYGTLLHRKLIKKHGLCHLHRVSFCCNI
jgi:ribonuclease HII